MKSLSEFINEYLIFEFKDDNCPVMSGYIKTHTVSKVSDSSSEIEMTIVLSKPIKSHHVTMVL